MLCKKSSKEVLSRQLQLANLKEYGEVVYARPGHCQDLDAGVHYLMNSKKVLDIQQKKDKSDVFEEE